MNETIKYIKTPEGLWRIRFKEGEWRIKRIQ